MAVTSLKHHLIHTIKNSGLGSLFLIVCLLLAACQPAGQRSMLVLSGPIMGTNYRITIVTDAHSAQTKEQLNELVLQPMNAVNDAMSTYLASSEVSKINQMPTGHVVELSSDTNSVLTEALRISELSKGAFDITVGQLVDVWGFGSKGSINQKPDPEKLLTLSESLGYKKLSLNSGKLSKQHSDTEIDLSAIAKGFAVDKVAQTLEQNGIQDYLIDIGGEVRAAGKNIDQQMWRVGIEKPQMLGGIQQIVVLDNKAIATSGDYLSYLVFDGERFSHTIDPRTLSPVLHKLALVSVIDEHAATADALATAMMVMGEVDALKFAQAHDIAAYFVIRGNGEADFTVKQSDKFIQYSQ